MFCLPKEDGEGCQAKVLLLPNHCTLVKLSWGAGYCLLTSVTVISYLTEHFERDLLSPSTQESSVVFEILVWLNPAISRPLIKNT